MSAATIARADDRATAVAGYLYSVSGILRGMLPWHVPADAGYDE